MMPPPLPLADDGRLRVAWICVPPSAGSGGHTTMFRMVEALERAGHQCFVYVQDLHGWSLKQHIRTIRGVWPRVRAEIRDLENGIEDCHAIFATGWMTAYPALASPARGVRMYLVQDLEPRFFAAGSESMLAEATYRFGFHGVTAGRWLAEVLRRDYGMVADAFDFGCDLTSYTLDDAPDASTSRTGICYYSRPSTPRRAHELAMLTLELFAERHPEVEIHFYGGPPARPRFLATEHGVLNPDQLGRLYNRCIAGLALSATNVSLVPHEMLACGCIPVVNDAEATRLVLDNPRVRYAPGTPFELAAALSALVERPAAERAEAAVQAAASVASLSWVEAGATVESIVCDVVTAACREIVAVL
jgi:glycosyltransferase involved in cell wall biosynthesis